MLLSVNIRHYKNRQEYMKNILVIINLIIIDLVVVLLVDRGERG